MSTTSPEVLVELDRSRPRGLRAQVEDELRDAIRSGRLAPGTRLPSTRALAADLGVTRGLVVAAYDQLLAEGYLSSKPGSGTVVSCSPEGHSPTKPAAAEQPTLAIDFRPGLPDLDLFPRGAWLRATRSALQTMPRDQLGYIDYRGLPQLRESLVDYLGRVRGVCADPDQIVICHGFGHGFGLVVRALHDLGHEVIAVEDPGHDDPRGYNEWAGLQSVGVEVDADGIVVDRLRRTPARAVLVTPAHQFPTGAVLSPSRRTDLVAWARAVDGYVIEDDYDAEYRYDRHPVGAIQGIAPERVVYSGTLSKTLAPGTRLGWLVLPPALVEPVVAARQMTDHATSSIMQATFADFLARGDLDRHLRRARRIYRQRRDALVASLARWFPGSTPTGIAAGLSMLVRLPDDLDEQAVTRKAAELGVGVYPLGNYCVRRHRDDPPAVVLGYGPLTPSQAEQGVRLLAQAAKATG